MTILLIIKAISIFMVSLLRIIGGNNRRQQQDATVQAEMQRPIIKDSEKARIKRNIDRCRLSKNDVLKMYDYYGIAH